VTLPIWRLFLESTSREGRPFDLEPLYARALALEDKVLDPCDKALAETSLEFAQLYIQEGKYREAEPHLARAVKIQEKNLGPSRELAASLRQYADLLRNLGQDGQADAIRDRADSMFQQHTPANP
jgi:tetratricopeptide (TPR) repeat protein